MHKPLISRVRTPKTCAPRHPTSTWPPGPKPPQAWVWSRCGLRCSFPIPP